MSEIAPLARTSLVPESRPSGENDAAFVELWLGTKVSAHTRRAYRSEIDRFRHALDKPFAWVTMADLQAYAEQLGQGSHKPATQNRALTAIKSLLTFGQETGYLPLNVGAAVKLRPSPDGLAQRILEESEVAKLIDQGPPGRDQVLLRLLYMSGVRVSELAQLKWCDLTPRSQAGQITVFGKGGKTRAILLKPKTWDALLTLRGEAGLHLPRRTDDRGGGRQGGYY
jgi:integrase/recombinase XerD